MHALARIARRRTFQSNIHAITSAAPRIGARVYSSENGAEVPSEEAKQPEDLISAKQMKRERDVARAREKRHNDPEWRAVLQARMRERSKTPEYKEAKNASRLAKYHSDPEYRAKHISRSAEIHREKMLNEPGYREAQRAKDRAWRLKKQADPIYREKKRQQRLARYRERSLNEPDFLEKIKARRLERLLNEPGYLEETKAKRLVRDRARRQERYNTDPEFRKAVDERNRRKEQNARKKLEKGMLQAIEQEKASEARREKKREQEQKQLEKEQEKLEKEQEKLEKDQEEKLEQEQEKLEKEQEKLEKLQDKLSMMKTWEEAKEARQQERERKKDEQTQKKLRAEEEQEKLRVVKEEREKLRVVKEEREKLKKEDELLKLWEEAERKKLWADAMRQDKAQNMSKEEIPRVKTRGGLREQLKRLRDQEALRTSLREKYDLLQNEAHEEQVHAESSKHEEAMIKRTMLLWINNSRVARQRLEWPHHDLVMSLEDVRHSCGTCHKDDPPDLRCWWRRRQSSSAEDSKPLYDCNACFFQDRAIYMPKGFEDVTTREQLLERRKTLFAANKAQPV